MKEKIPQKTESVETHTPEKAVVFVPGLGASGLEVYQDVARELGADNTTGEHVPFFVVSTHPEHESQRQYALSKDEMDNPAPVMCVVNDAEGGTHDSFENRIALTEQAIEQAVQSGAKDISVVGHSAGGAATLAALARMVSKGLNADGPNVHGVLVAPAVPGEARKLVTAEPMLFKIMMRDLVSKLMSLQPSYVSGLLSGKDIRPEDKDLRELLGPMEDADLEERALKGAVPISGREGRDLLMYPKTMMGLDADTWPDNLRIDVVIPKDDQWVSREGQRMLVALLTELGKDKAGVTEVDGGHLPLGEQDAAAKVAKIIQSD